MQELQGYECYLCADAGTLTLAGCFTSTLAALLARLPADCFGCASALQGFCAAAGSAALRILATAPRMSVGQSQSWHTADVS